MKAQAIALTWAQRAQAELGAQSRFHDLCEQLRAAQAQATVIQLCEKAEKEEKEHAEICAKIASQLGHPTGFAFFEGQGVEIKKPWVERESPRERLLCEIVLMCCIAETINASLLNTIYSQAKDSPQKKAIQKILKDEVKHSQLGWAHLAAENHRQNCEFIGEFLGVMLEIAVKDELFAPPPVAIDQASYDYGVMPVEHRLDQFKRTFKEIVLPGFKNFNIPTESAEKWLRNKSDESL